MAIKGDQKTVPEAPEAAAAEPSEGSSETTEEKKDDEKPKRPKKVFVKSRAALTHAFLLAFYIGVVGYTLGALLTRFECSEAGSCAAWCPSQRDLFYIAVLAATLGGLIHSTTSFVAFAGNRQLLQSWLPWFHLRALIGAMVGLLIYVGYRSGFYKVDLLASCELIYRFAFVSAVSGLFSKQVIEKLSDIVDNILTPAKPVKRDDPLKADDDETDTTAKAETPPAKPITQTPPEEILREVRRRLVELGHLKAKDGEAEGAKLGTATTKAIEEFLAETEITGAARSATLGDESDADFWTNLTDLMGQARVVKGKATQ